MEKITNLAKSIADVGNADDGLCRLNAIYFKIYFDQSLML